MIGSRRSMAVRGSPLSVASFTFCHCLERSPGTANVSSGRAKKRLRTTKRLFIGPPSFPQRSQRTERELVPVTAKFLQAVSGRFRIFLEKTAALPQQGLLGPEPGPGTRSVVAQAERLGHEPTSSET